MSAAPKLSTMTQDLWFIVSSCFFFFFFFFFGEFFLFLIVDQLELGLAPFTEDPRTL